MENSNSSHSDSFSERTVLVLLRTRGPAMIVYAACIVLAVLSLLLFVYQLAYEARPAMRTTSPVAEFFHVCRHAARAATAVLLAISLHRYLGAISALSRDEAGAVARVVASIATWWKSVVAGIVVAMAYGILAVILSQRPANSAIDRPTTLHLSADTDTDTDADTPDILLEFYLADYATNDTPDAIVVAEHLSPIVLQAKPVVTQNDIADVIVVTGPNGSPQLDVTFTAEGAAAMREATRQHMDRPLAILLDNQVVTAPIIRTEIAERACIDGFGTQDEVERIARVLTGQRQLNDEDDDSTFFVPVE